MEIIYGPVPSWRFGRSLGVDTTTKPKKCTYNCIYCQLGRTKEHVTNIEAIQKQLPTPEQVEESLKQYLKNIDKRSIDFVTVSGTGEPTLNLSLGEILKVLRKYFNETPIGILTNSSLLPKDTVYEAVSKFDFISAKFDAGDEKTFKQINRPAGNQFSFKEIKESIKRLVADARGKVAVETMLLKTTLGVSNISGEPYKRLLNGIVEINPDIVQLYTPWRPGAEEYVQVLSTKKLNEISEDLALQIGKEKLWVYGQHEARGEAVVWKNKIDARATILELLKRRPCRLSDLTYNLNIQLSTALRVIRELTDENKLSIRDVNGETFYFLL
ncbi:MAG: radical SAM protein [Candidatus Odinarchaeia archaeon]